MAANKPANAGKQYKVVGSLVDSSGNIQNGPVTSEDVGGQEVIDFLLAVGTIEEVK